jgi:MoaA/NifB/PqqE/SkfB family radical SAM enzyme
MYAVDELIADAFAVRDLREAVDMLHPTQIRCVKIKITSRCNLRCHMCHYWQTEHEQTLPTERWRDVLSQLAGLGCRKVHFSGGEVFLRRDFLDIVEHGVAVGMKVNMTTNGTLLTPPTVKRLVKARPNSLSISLDGPRASVHDAVRGVAGSFARTTRAIRQIQSYGERIGHRPKVRINFVVMRDNFRRLPEMVELAAELGAEELHPMPVDEKGAGGRRLSRSQIELYNRELAPRVHELRARHGFSTSDELVYPFGRTDEEVRLARKGQYALGFYARHACLAPWLHLFIAWNGDCFLCCMTNHRMSSLGNVGRDSVQDVFWGERFKRVRADFVKGQMHAACRRCDMFLSENQAMHSAMAAATARAPLPGHSDTDAG